MPGTRTFLAAAAVAVAGVLAGVASCATVHRPADAPSARFVMTAAPNNSMIFLARTSDGILAVDLGWLGAEEALRSGLADLGADSSHVTAVFITHAHRDHIAAWPLVREAEFFMGAPEVPLFLGEEEPEGWIPRWAEALVATATPAPGELRVRGIERDTMVVVGSEEVRIFLVPGHTPGSAAYLFRGILFAGDALTHSPVSGFGPARRGFSDDAGRAEASLADLFRRLEPYEVRQVCTAHGDCAPYSEAFRREVLRDGR